MHYGELKKCDIANGIGVRVTLFVSGCTNHCPDCFQPQTWDFDYGKPFTGETKAEIFAELDKPFINGLTVLGGEPFEPRNQRELLPLLREVREKYQRAGGRAVRQGAEGHLPPVPGQPEPAGHRHGPHP
mgnify:CR=1 FL=1